jgi:hypothetical protein
MHVARIIYARGIIE